MLERSELYLKILCGVLAVVVALQIARMGTAKDPLKEINVAFLSSSTNTPSASTNSATTAKTTNAPPTNALPTTASSTNAVSTNSPIASGARSSPPRPPTTARGPSGRAGGASDLPPAVNTRVEKIKDSEVFGAVPRPLPMALLGIAGKDVFLRTPTGQTGLVREGEEFGGVKILQIGTNRVLVELEGQRQELTVFEGFGSGSLMLKGKETK